MSINKEFLDRPTNITAKIIKDSVNTSGNRMTTYELEFPRFLHCELLTHRMLSKNCSSSRAIPIEKMIEYTRNNTAMPVYWGKKKKGMQASEEVEEGFVRKLWLKSFNSAVGYLESMDDALLHKQIANRVIEPYTMMKVVLTATDFDNFWNLRFHKDTLPEFVMLVHKMYQAMEASEPNLLQAGQWHLPYVKTVELEGFNEIKLGYNNHAYIKEEFNGQQYFDLGGSEMSLEQALKYSTSHCASVSYRTESLPPVAVENIYNMLVGAEVVHSSPLEHQGMPMQDGFWSMSGFLDVNVIDDAATWEDGVTHMRRDGTLCSGNLTGFVQHRHLISNNTCNDFDFDLRYEDFL